MKGERRERRGEKRSVEEEGRRKERAEERYKVVKCGEETGGDRWYWRKEARKKKVQYRRVKERVSGEEG